MDKSKLSYSFLDSRTYSFIGMNIIVAIGFFIDYKQQK